MEWRHSVTLFLWFLKLITVKRVIYIFIVEATWCVVITTSIEFTCPSLLLTRIVAKKLCVHKTNHCLRVDNTNIYRQNCIDSEPIEKGSYPILGDDNVTIYQEYCPADRYQPQPMFSNERNECWYSKSTCTGEGQLVHTDRSRTQDRTCRCDYTKNFMFVTRPQAGCYCVPSQEDCSCYRVACPDTYRLTQDYECADPTTVTQFRCPEVLWTADKTKETKDKSAIPVADVEKRDVLRCSNYRSLTPVIFVIGIGLTIGFILTIYLLRIVTGCIDHEISPEKGTNSKQEDQQQDQLKQQVCYTEKYPNGIIRQQNITA